MKRFPILMDEEIEKVIAQISSYNCVPSRRPLLVALFTLLANLGLRISEALDVRPQDCHFQGGDITIRTLKQCLKKNGKIQIVEDTLPLNDITSKALQEVCQGKAPQERIFPWSRKVVWNIFQRLLHQAGIPPIKLHALRHSAVTRWVATGDLAFAMMMARHKNLQTTSLYTHCVKLRECFLSLKAIGKEA